VPTAGLAEVSRRSGWAGMVMVPRAWPGLAVESCSHAGKGSV